MKILVTGSEGFIGSHLTETLLKKGYKVRAFVLYNSFNSWGWLEDLPEEIKKNLEVFMGDIRDPNGVREALKGCDTVLQLEQHSEYLLYLCPHSYPVNDKRKELLLMLPSAKRYHNL